MTRILFIQTSPRGSLSASAQVADAYIDALKQKGPINVDLLDVWKEDLPPFDGPAIEAKYAGLAGQPVNASQQAAWDAIVTLGARFHAADQIVMSVPMWNFSVPYRLKHLIDLVTQKNVTFTFDEKGFDGMLKRQRAVIMCARGLGYVDGTPLSEESFDYQKAYLISWLTFLGVTDIKTVTMEKTLFGPEVCAESTAAGVKQAVALANGSALAA